MAEPDAEGNRVLERPSHIVANQSEVAAWLGDPATYGADVKAVERIDTHGAMVFLAGERAYKIKRAVRYPYMDFSTLALRRAACAREVALNQRTAPELYLGTESIVRKPSGALAFGGAGEVLEWAVVMRRFDQAGLCDRLAEAGQLTPETMVALADEIAALHDVAEPVFDETGGGADGLRAVVAENASELAERPDLFPETRTLESESLHALDRVASLLDARREAGLVRRCHGDLHLRNICVIDGRPRLFDCIDFNDTISCIDVLYDLAFLLMDLEHRDLRHFANLVLNRYLQRRDDIDGLAALPLFLSARAAVRAKVNVSMAASQNDPASKNLLLNDARTYEAAAHTYLRPVPPRLVVVGGLSGTGKTRLARALAPELGASPGALHLRSDVIRKTLAGVDDITRLPSEAYTQSASENVYAELSRRARAALNAGRTVVADAVFAKAGERAAIETLAKDLGVPFTGLWLEASQDVLLRRVNQRKGDASDATATVVRDQQSYDLGFMSWARIDASADIGLVTAAARRILEDDHATLG